MKKLFTSAILVLAFVLHLYSQIPEKFNYQGVLRTSSGELVKNTSITVKVSLLQGSTSGSTVYSENHTVTTNNYGQFAVLVGGGTVLIGTFSNIDWSQQMYQKTEVANPSGGTLVDMGTVQLISVPYAMYSDKAKILDNNLLYFTDSDTLFAVKDRDGNIVFAVFPDGAKVYTPVDSKGKVGGFAVSGRTSTKQGEEFDYLRVTADSTRIYVNDTSTNKGKVGGFAVSGRTSTKGEAKPFMDMTKNNYFIGHEAGYSNTKGLYNSFLGYMAGKNNTVGSNNQFIGFNSGLRNSTGNYNTFIGYNTVVKANSPYTTIAIGHQAAAEAYKITVNNDSVTMGSIYIGNNSGEFDRGTHFNLFFGNSAGQNNLGTNNMFFGTASGINNIGDLNMFIGGMAGHSSNGNENIFIGGSSGSSHQNGSFNTYLGHNSGGLGGSDNINVGYASGSISEGDSNIYIGKYAGRGYKGNGNIIIGFGNRFAFDNYFSNKLFINNSKNNLPLIYGEFDNEKLIFNSSVNIRDFMVLEPRDTAPDSPTKGTVYFDNNDNKAKMWDGTAWQSLW